MILRRALTVVALGFAVMGSAHAQTVAENRDADALAADMRLLAANPRDAEALIIAGELTLKMGDYTASAGFFGRAEKLEPLNARVKAGLGSLMLRAERPGEALRRFQEAEMRGLDSRRFAADRGLAFDLVGEQERAQRDYRLALRVGPDEEVSRRYALSLGISGRKDLAFKLLEPLLRTNDRAAWRDRAFILAMSGDTDGAQKIASTMMSPVLAAGLTPFFQRLPLLAPADRAFAVTFGELRPTPERTADARLVPALPKLAADPYAPREVAVVVPVKTVSVDGERKRKKRKKGDLVAEVQPPPSARADAGLAPPAYVEPVPAPRLVQPVRIAAAPPRALPAPAPPPVTIAKAVKAVPAPPQPTAPVIVVEQAKPVLTPFPTPSASKPPVLASAAATTPPEAASLPARAPLVPAARAGAGVLPGVTNQPSAAEAGISDPNATARVSEDTVLAKIVSDLGSRATAAAPTPLPEPQSAQVRPPTKIKPEGVPVTATRQGMAAIRAAETKKGKAKATMADAPIDPKSRKADRPSAETADATDTKDTKARGRNRRGDDPRARDGCAVPAANDRVGAKTKANKARSNSGRREGKATPDAPCRVDNGKDKKADASPKGEAARVWVQVAGGANQSSLEKSWAAIKAQAPELFKGRQGWSTPLRNTNRVLAGPFKSTDDAQAFVNRLAKAGLSGFVFTSIKGQKIDHLGAK